MMVGLAGVGSDLGRAGRSERRADDGRPEPQAEDGPLAMLGELMRELGMLERCHAGAAEAQGGQIAVLIGLLLRHADARRRSDEDGTEARAISAAVRALAARLGIPVSEAQAGGITLDAVAFDGEDARRFATLISRLRAEIAALRGRMTGFRG